MEGGILKDTEGNNMLLEEIDRIAAKKKERPLGPVMEFLGTLKEEIRSGVERGLSAADLCLAIERTKGQKVSHQTMRRFLKAEKMVRKKSKKAKR